MKLLNLGLAKRAAAMLRIGSTPQQVATELGVSIKNVWNLASGRTYRGITGGPIDWKANRPPKDRPRYMFIVDKEDQLFGRDEWLTNLAMALIRLRRRSSDSTAEKRLIMSANAVFLPVAAAELMDMPLDAWLDFKLHGRMSPDDQARLIVIGDEMLVCKGHAHRYAATDAATIAVAQSGRV